MEESMKKLALVLAIILVISTLSALFVACTEEEKPANDNTTTTTKTTTTTTTTTTKTDDNKDPDQGGEDEKDDAPDTTGAICINDIEGVDARVYAFEQPSEFGGPIGLIYYFEDKTDSTHTAMAAAIADGGHAVVSLNGKLFTIEQYANGAPWFRFNVETPGAVIYAGLSYKVIVYVYNAEGTMVYYTTEQTITSSLSSANAGERTGLNIDLPEGLNKLTVDSATVQATGLNAWGDGAATNLFDGNTESTKLGGGTSGNVEVTFSLSAEATVTYYTLYTGNDTATNSSRNPAGWTLYGLVGEEYVVLDTVAASEEYIAGLEATNSTPYSYAVDNATACTEYKIVFVNGGVIQLNEMELFAA